MITYSSTTLANVSDGASNLSPFFSHKLTDIYNAENNPNGYWMDNGTYGWIKNSKFTFTQLEDGWLHVHIDNSSGTSTIRNDCCVPKYNPSIKRATKYTFLAEFRNNQSTGAASGSDFYLVQQSGSVQFWGQNVTTAPLIHLEGIGTTTVPIFEVPSDGSYAFSRFTKFSESDGESSHWTTNDKMVTFVFRANAGAILDYDVRLSIYEGEYWGNYVPYIISDVTDIRNSAEEANEKIDNLKVGGRNLLRHTGNLQASDLVLSRASLIEPNIIRITPTTSSGYAKFAVDYLNYGNYKNSTFVVSMDVHIADVESTYTTLNNLIVYYGVSIASRINSIFGSGYDYYYSKTIDDLTTDWQRISITFTIPDDLKTGQTSALVDNSQVTIQVAEGGSRSPIEIRNVKLEMGNHATDWTPAPEDVEDSIKIYAESIQSQVDGMAEIHYGTAVPTLSNAPYTSWTDTATRDMHVDDLYYNTSTGYCYRFIKSDSTYSWSRIKDSDITAAATAASNANTAAGNAQTTANNANTLAGQKRRIFVAQPTPPYEIGDLWVEGSNGDIKKCKTARATGSYTASDWELASKYTDDTLANEANDKIDNLEIGGRNLLRQDPKNYSATSYAAYDLALTEPLEANQKYIIQLWDVDVSHTGKTAEQLNVAVYYCGGGLTFGKWQGTEYFTDGHADYLTFSFTPTSDNINRTDVTNAVIKFIRLYNSVSSASGTMNMHVEKWKLEKGDKATDWTPTPEDTDASIQQVQNNLDDLEIGGRNLLYNSATMPAVSNGDKGWRASGGTVTHIDLTNPPIYNITGAIRVTNTGSSTTNIGIAQDRIINKFITGEKYTQSCWVRASETLRIYLSPIWAANDKCTGGSVPFLGYFSIGTEWTYIKWEGAVLQGEQAASYSAGYVYAYQAPANSWLEVCGMKLEKGAKATDWTPAPEDTQADIDTALAQSVEYIIGTQTAATGTWTGNSIDKELKVGKTIAYKLPYAGSGNASLVLTLADGSVTNAIAIYLNTTRVTTHFGAGAIINMTYDGTYWRASSIPNTNNVDRTQYGIALAASEAIAAARIAVLGTNGKLHLLNTTAFDITCPPLYVGTAYSADNVTAGTTRTSNYRYWGSVFNYTNTHSIADAVAGKPIYIVGTLNGNIFTPNSTVLTCTEPTTENGLYYMRLGTMSTTTNGVLEMDHPIYIFYNGSFITIEKAEAEKAQDLATAVYGTCSTAAETAAKSVVCDNFILFNGARIQITFTYANTASVPTLNVNNTGAKSIYINKSVVSASNQLLWSAGSKMEFVYDGTGWILQNAPFSLYGTCNTASATANKEVVCNEAIICKGSVISIKMTYSNTAASAKLNVASTGVKNIKANGADLTVNSRFNWNAGATIAFTFDGQYWNMSDDTITAYVTDTNDDGIMIHPVNDQNTGWSIGNSIQLLKNSISYIKLWLENNIAKIRIGEENKGHIIIDNNSVDVMNNNTCLASFGETSTIGQTNGAHIEQNSSGLQVIDADGNNQVIFGAQSTAITWKNSITTIPPSTEENNIVQIELPTELASDQNMTLTIDTTVYTIPTRQTYSYTHTNYTISYDGTYTITITNLSTSILNSTLDYPITQPLNYGITAITPNATRIKARAYANNTVIAEGGIYANDAGNFGLYDTKRTSWMMVSTADGTVKIPSLIPKLISTTKVIAPATKSSWAYIDI
ncbi:MAG: hypothetical protein LIR50_10630 [Bacillota bacterium]|nr:hypothetical protein [Bacillota bacterium]